MKFSFLLLPLLLLPPRADGGGRFAEMMLTFPNPRAISYRAEPASNALTIELKETAPAELGALERYDERVLRRVLVTDLGPEGSTIRLYLRDRRLRAHVATLQEPFRVSISIFDHDYSPQVDPETELPLAGFGAQDLPSQEPWVGAPSVPTAGGGLVRESRVVSGSDLPAFPSPNTPEAGRRRLLQPPPTSDGSPDALRMAIDRAPAGRGAGWATYPAYIYPLQTAAYEGRAPAGSEVSKEALANAAMGFKLFTFGHEQKALLIYQHVLHNSPLVFEKDDLHLWAFSELNFGRGNHTLADGYYQALVEKFPESALAGFARLRRLDVRALRDPQASTKPLVAELATIDGGKNAELQAQIAIRRAFWSASGWDDKTLPALSQQGYDALRGVLGALETQQTSYLGTSLIVGRTLIDAIPWQKTTGDFAEGYFQRFTDPERFLYQKTLRQKLYRKLARHLVASSAAQKYMATIRSFEDVPPGLSDVGREAKVAWAVAEAYRNLGQIPKALPFYRQAGRRFEAGVPRFRALFWHATTAGETLAKRRRERGSSAQMRNLSQQMKAADVAMEKSWQGLNPEERSKLRIVYRPHFERSLSQPFLLRTPAEIVLEAWSEALATKVDASSTDTADASQNFSPTAGTVHLLRKLADRFRRLGLTAKRRAALVLLKKVMPSLYPEDRTAQQAWAEGMLRLAEGYRKSRSYLEAGEVYTYVATNSRNWEKRAEALYKGGLLLFRAGRREKAIEALTSASQDGDSVYYATLAKERLSQLKK